MPDHTTIQDRTVANARPSAVTMQKWGGLASFLLVVAIVISSLIYLTGNLQEAFGPVTYALADFLSGPVWAASLVTAVYALRERLRDSAPRRMDLALSAALVAAAVFVAVVCIRSANRHYHLIHPELHLEESSTVLIVWATLVAGMIGTAWHFLGWTWVLVGGAGWTTRGLPRVLSVLYLVAGASALFVYLLPELEGQAVAVGIVVSLWQGVLLWKGDDSLMASSTRTMPILRIILLSASLLVTVTMLAACDIPIPRPDPTAVAPIPVPESTVGPDVIIREAHRVMTEATSIVPPGPCRFSPTPNDSSDGG